MGPGAEGVLIARILPLRKTGWNAASAHERDNPGNNMRTLSLSRTLSVDLQRCGLPEVRGSRAPLKRAFSRFCSNNYITLRYI